MTAPQDGVERRPWWYSGEDDGVPDEPESSTSESDGAAPNGGMDWSMLMMGAAKMVDWATERVMAPHAEHQDPAEHPQCVVCRTILLVGDPEGLGLPVPPGPSDGSTRDDGVTTSAIRWIPIVERPTAT